MPTYCRFLYMMGLQGEESNFQSFGYEPSALPLSYPAVSWAT